jgi:predicted alpha/beta superfamily hydrolase
VEQVGLEFRVHVPPATPRDARVYISGSIKALGGWKAEGLLLERQPDGTYQGRTTVPKGGVLDFKVTRGSWQTVEKGPQGEDLPNHEVFLECHRVVRVEVAAWGREEAAEQPATLTGHICFHKNFPSRFLKERRRLTVYLPPSYGDWAESRYPVLYLHDGQNVFDEATAAYGVEWKADETAERLIRAGRVRPVIIVAIDSVPDRIGEYTPLPRPDGRVGGKGDLYARFVAEEVKPFIDRTYRTRRGRADTAVAGSSLGGLISLHIARRYPQVFSMCGAISPVLWWRNEEVLRELETPNSDIWLTRTKFWVDMGTAEGALPGGQSPELARTRRLAARLAAAGLVADRDYAYREFLGASHGEAAWAARFDEVLTFFFPGPNALAPRSEPSSNAQASTAGLNNPAWAARGAWGVTPVANSASDLRDGR